MVEDIQWIVTRCKHETGQPTIGIGAGNCYLSRTAVRKLGSPERVVIGQHPDGRIVVKAAGVNDAGYRVDKHGLARFPSSRLAYPREDFGSHLMELRDGMLVEVPS